MDGRWYGPALTFHTRGPTDRANNLKGLVREKAGYLFGTLLPGQNYTIGKWMLADGSKVQVQVMRQNGRERVFSRVWVPTTGELLSTFTYYLESGFIVPSQELVTTFTTTDARLVKDIRDALFIHNDRVREWSSWDIKELGFTPEPTGDVLVARTQPLSLGFDEPKEELNYYNAYRRWYKTWQNFGEYDTWETNLMYGRGPGTSTGKMVLYQRAKLGRRVADWISEASVYDDYVLNDWAASHTCTGLFTDQFGDYWKVAIDNSTTATFTRLYTPADLKAVRDRATTPRARLFIEGFALGYSSLTDQVYTINISGVPTLHEAGYSKWNPVAYSWHFNWDGSKACMVVHRGVSSIETGGTRLDHVQSEVWELAVSVSLSGGVYTPRIACSTGARSLWHRITEVQSDLIYVPSIAESSKCMSVWSCPGTGANPGYPSASNVPLYAWYGVGEGGVFENDTLYKVLYSRNRVVLEEEMDPDYYLTTTVWGSSVHTGGGTLTNGVAQDGYYKLVTDDGQVAILEASSPGNVYTRTVQLSEGGSYSTYSTTFSGSAVALTDNSTGVPVTTLFRPVTGDYLVLVDMTTYYWQPTVITVLDAQSNPPPNLGLVIPHDCAEGAVFAKYAGFGRSVTTTTRVDSPVPSAKYRTFTNIRSYPSLTVIGDTLTEGMGQADYTTTAVTETTYGYDLGCIAFGRNPTDPDRYTEASTGEEATVPSVADPKGSPEGFTYSQFDSEDPTAPPCSLFEAFGGELMIRAVEDHFKHDFPAGFGAKLTPPVIIGSI